tara:strand:- start:450 stop:806 length:357 start_codon:yes stop_codon:yes gene_type:complete
MNKYALNIDTKQLEKKISYINNFNNEYNFLNHIKIDKIEVYYDILNNLEDFKLKNIYNFIYKRIDYLDKNNNFPYLNVKENIEPDNLNKYLNNYINYDTVKGIIIMNLIQLYYYPTKF